MGYRKFATQGVLGGEKVIKYGNYTAFGGLKLYPALLRFMTLKSLVEFKRAKDVTISWSPFGRVEYGGTAFAKGAPVTKGKTIEEIRALGPIGEAIVGGLRKAVEVSKRFAGVKGVALVHHRTKGLLLMPMKAAMQLKEQHPELVIAGPTPV